eukprot:3751272-Alexandrium_andersonii.AAC.1
MGGPVGLTPRAHLWAVPGQGDAGGDGSDPGEHGSRCRPLGSLWLQACWRTYCGRRAAAAVVLEAAEPPP